MESCLEYVDRLLGLKLKRVVFVVSGLDHYRLEVLGSDEIFIALDHKSQRSEGGICDPCSRLVRESKGIRTDAENIGSHLVALYLKLAAAALGEKYALSDINSELKLDLKQKIAV